MAEATAEPTKEFLSIGLEGRSIDKSRGVIAGVSVITQGPALGHNHYFEGENGEVLSAPLFIDEKTVSGVFSLLSGRGGSLKVKMEHGTDAKDIVGSLRNFRIDGEQLRADFKLLKNSQYYGQIVEMASEMPEQFGMSIAFATNFELSAEKDKSFFRAKEIYSADIVDSPAANPNGFLSMPKEDPEHPQVDTLKTNNMAETNATVATPETPAAPAFDAAQALAALTASVDKLNGTVAGLQTELTAVKDQNEALRVSVEASRGTTPVTIAPEKTEEITDPKERARARVAKSVSALGIGKK